jgi:tRNA(His) 5'-end guanylyltransferase
MGIANIHDYMARVEQAVQHNISLDTRVIAVQEWEINEREGYWERVYIVAWINERESGTHRANIDSEDNAALFNGEYLHGDAAARQSFYERVGR